MNTKIADSKGRIMLGNAFANKMFLVDDSNPERIIITKAIAIPEQEAWLYANEQARDLVRLGLDQASTNQFSETPPDIDGDAEFASELES